MTGASGTARYRATLALLALSCLALPVQGQAPALPATPSHMPEADRASVSRLVVLPGAAPATHSVGGSYQQQTDGLYGGLNKGAAAGKGVSTDIGGIPIGIPLPILTLPGALIGGLKGANERRLQELRDALARDLVDASRQPLRNDALAADVFWQLRELPRLDSRILDPAIDIPAGSDAILYVAFNELGIDVQEDEATIRVAAHATLRRVSDGSNLYSRTVTYEDRDTLENWVRDDTALWRSFADFARHYAARELAGETFRSVHGAHTLKPVASKSTKRIKRDPWRLASRSTTPTLAWEAEAAGGSSEAAWLQGLDATGIDYEVEIYDANRPVYASGPIQGTHHRVDIELEPCASYRWSVRPSYRSEGGRRFGDWMRAAGGAQTQNGSRGPSISTAPAYIYDFATLEIDCRARATDR